MLEGKRVGVVVPAHDEEALIAATVGGVPGFVDRNGGVGAAIVTGYKRALADRVDVTCVMAADNQMDPADLESLVLPVVRGEVDYAKANRLVSGQAGRLVPPPR